MDQGRNLGRAGAEKSEKDKLFKDRRGRKGKTIPKPPFEQRVDGGWESSMNLIVEPWLMQRPQVVQRMSS